MLQLLSYLVKEGIVTQRSKFPLLDDGVRGLPKLTDAPCSGDQCAICANVCPTEAITVNSRMNEGEVTLDLGACIACGQCVVTCPTGTIINDRQTTTAQLVRDDLVLKNIDNIKKECQPNVTKHELNSGSIFKNSIAARVVSTGCSACDLEIGAAGNPIFDTERFGVKIVASPRFADVLLVTGPVPKAMHDPLLRCYDAMAEPRKVIAVGTCAITGGVHKNGYTKANGADSIVPVDVYIPGCPPHPWSIIYGIHLAMQS